MSSQLYFVLLSLSCSIICHRSKYKLNFSIRSMSYSQLLKNHHGSHALFSFISLDSKCIPYVFNLYYPVYSFVDFNKSSLQKKNIYIKSCSALITMLFLSSSHSFEGLLSLVFFYN